MAGTIPGFSLAQQLDSNGTPLVGCKLYTYQAGTTSTPQTAYQDSGLTLPLPFPILGDAYGRLPQIFLADGSIKLRLTRANGTQVFALDGVLVVGASSGGGGGSPVDPTTVLSTGDMKLVYNTGIYAGFVRANGRTIGSATSGATERANVDCLALFTFLWGNDGNLAVSGGRGASAAADWSANKTIALPDFRGRAIAGLDDMGNTGAGRLSATYFGTSSTVLGAAGGSESNSVILTHNHTINETPHSHGLQNGAFAGSPAGFQDSARLAAGPNSGSPQSNQTSANNVTGITINNAGSAGAHNIVQHTILLTIHIKL